MISGVFGLPGSGKTMFLSYIANMAVSGIDINSHFQHFGQFGIYDNVYSSFPFDGAYRLDFDTLGKCNYKNTLFLIDEIMVFCDSRNFKTFSDDLKEFFSQHRKDGNDIIYASQSYDDCDKKIRGLTDTLYYVTPSIIPNYAVIKPIRAYFRIAHGKIQQGYEFDSPMFNFYLNLKKCYSLTDTKFHVTCRDRLLPAPVEHW